MKLDKNTKILILGLGLMGGSYAQSLTAHGFEVGAIARRQETIDYALREGIIKSGRADIDPGYIAQFDLLIFAMYPHAFVEWIESYQQYIKPNALITDVTGVKCSIIYKIQGMLRPDLEFVGAHPMAGANAAALKTHAWRYSRAQTTLLRPRTRTHPRLLRHAGSSEGLWAFA